MPEKVDMRAETREVVVFRLEDQRHAIPVALVERVFRMVEITPAPHPHPLLAGAIDFQGQVVPVVDTRKLFGLPTREVELSDQLILVRAGEGLTALWVEAGTTIFAPHPDSTRVESPDRQTQSWSAQAVCRTGDGLIFIHDLDSLLRPLGHTADRPCPTCAGVP